MDRIRGRSDDMLIIRGVNVFPSQIEEKVLAIPALAPHYQLEVYKDGPLDALDVHVEVGSGGIGPDAAAAAGIALEKAIKAYIGVSARVCVHPAGGVPRSQGKAVRITRR